MSNVHKILRISDVGDTKINRSCDICNKTKDLIFMGMREGSLIAFCSSCYMDLSGSKCSVCGKPLMTFLDGIVSSGLCTDCKGVGKRVLEKFK